MIAALPGCKFAYTSDTKGRVVGWNLKSGQTKVFTGIFKERHSNQFPKDCQTSTQIIVSIKVRVEKYAGNASEIHVIRRRIE